MKIRLAGKWNFIRMLRLIVGISGTVQGIVIKEFAFSIAGFLLVYMAVAGLKTGEVDEVELEEIKLKSKENEHEKLDSY
jgi:hypothetical protein